MPPHSFFEWVIGQNIIPRDVEEAPRTRQKHQEPQRPREPQKFNEVKRPHKSRHRQVFSVGLETDDDAGVDTLRLSYPRTGQHSQGRRSEGESKEIPPTQETHKRNPEKTNVQPSPDAGTDTQRPHSRPPPVTVTRFKKPPIQPSPDPDIDVRQVVEISDNEGSTIEEIVPGCPCADCTEARKKETKIQHAAFKAKTQAQHAAFKAKTQAQHAAFKAENQATKSPADDIENTSRSVHTKHKTTVTETVKSKTSNNKETAKWKTKKVKEKSETEADTSESDKSESDKSESDKSESDIVVDDDSDVDTAVEAEGKTSSEPESESEKETPKKKGSKKDKASQENPEIDLKQRSQKKKSKQENEKNSQAQKDKEEKASQSHEKKKDKKKHKEKQKEKPEESEFKASENEALTFGAILQLLERHKKDEERRKDEECRKKDEERRKKDEERRKKDEERRKKDEEHRKKDEESRKRDEERRRKDEESQKKDEERRKNDKEKSPQSHNSRAKSRHVNFVLPAKSRVVHVEHAVEDPQDPRPNAFYDNANGITRVYHGPVYGNPHGALYPPPGIPSDQRFPVGTPHPMQNPLANKFPPPNVPAQDNTPAAPQENLWFQGYGTTTVGRPPEDSSAHKSEDKSDQDNYEKLHHESKPSATKPAKPGGSKHKTNDQGGQSNVIPITEPNGKKPLETQSIHSSRKGPGSKDGSRNGDKANGSKDTLAARRALEECIERDRAELKAKETELKVREDLLNEMKSRTKSTQTVPETYAGSGSWKSWNDDSSQNHINHQSDDNPWGGNHDMMNDRRGWNYENGRWIYWPSSASFSEEWGEGHFYDNDGSRGSKKSSNDSKSSHKRESPPIRSPPGAWVSSPTSDPSTRSRPPGTSPNNVGPDVGGSKKRAVVQEPRNVDENGGELGGGSNRKARGRVAGWKDEGVAQSSGGVFEEDDDEGNGGGNEEGGQSRW
ncbi:hypothetical protein F4804DRAFT_298064 [Jackrogersella minutella]|nr:hypothetical protein F4804DRAFT_298064 [Jackrogersella minutella]